MPEWINIFLLFSLPWLMLSAQVLLAILRDARRAGKPKAADFLAWHIPYPRRSNRRTA